MGWYAAKAYGMEEPLPTNGDINTDPSAIKPLTVEESVDALVKEVQLPYFASNFEKRLLMS